MSLSRYKEYVNVQVEWLGQIPSHWSLPPLYLRYQAELGKMLDTSRITGKNLLPYLRNVDVQWGRINLEDLPEIDVEPSELSRYTVRVGDLLVCEGGEVGRAAVVTSLLGTTAFQKALHRLRAIQPNEVPKYMFYVFCWAVNAGIFNNNGQSTIAHLTGEQLRKYRFPCPPFDEQAAIAAFLDRETSKIDALIAEQENLIALLSEKRQATISHTVTKGLNPNAPMKDSGVAWLGEVPADWNVVTFQRCVYVQEGQVNPEEEPYRSMLLIAPNHIESGTGRLLYVETAQEQSAESGKYLCKSGDVIYSKIRPALRKVCIATEDCLCSADMYPLRGTSTLLNSFLKWFMLSEPFSALAVLESERVAMPKINRESLKAVWLPVPTLHEQETIDVFLLEETAKLDALKDEASRAIKLLAERRSVLVAAAVTGQIDVRGALPQAPIESSEALAA